MTKNRIAKFNIEQIGIDEDVLFNLMTHDAKYDLYALRPDEVTELQNSIKAIIDDRDHLRAINAAQLEALQILVIIDRSDNIGDPDTLATDRWRHEAWSNAYAIIDAETV